MSKLLTDLIEKRANVWEQTKAHLDAVETEGREFTGESKETYDRLHAEMRSLDERIEDLFGVEERNKRIEEARQRLGVVEPQADSAAPSFGEQFRSWAKGGGTREFEYRDQTTTTGAGTIPQGFRAKLWEYAVENAGILQAGVDLLETTSGEQIKLPRVTAYSTVGAITEGVAITESDPTFGSVNSDVTKRGYIVQVTRELLDDSAFDLEKYLAKWAGRELGNDIGAAAVTAAVAAASAGATGATGTTTSFGTQSTAGSGYDYLITLFHSVLAPYRTNASWVMSDPTAAAVRKIKSADGIYVWQPGMIPGVLATMENRPVYIDTNVADPAANAESIIFGDFSSLVVRIAGGIRFERSDDFAFNTDMATFKAVARHGTVSVDANALKTFTHSAT